MKKTKFITAVRSFDPDHKGMVFWDVRDHSDKGKIRHIGGFASPQMARTIAVMFREAADMAERNVR